MILNPFLVVGVEISQLYIFGYCVHFPFFTKENNLKDELWHGDPIIMNSVLGVSVAVAGTAPIPYKLPERFGGIKLGMSVFSGRILNSCKFSFSRFCQLEYLNSRSKIMKFEIIHF